MKLKNKKTNEEYEANISSVEKDDYDWIEKSNQYTFDWKVERKNNVYKIYLVENREHILGVMALIDKPKEWRIHIQLIEISSQNVGKNKTYEHIAGCLIAFACRFAFDKQYDGFVSLEPKTKLAQHYHDKYGFKPMGIYMAVESDIANSLIQKYLSA